nr:ubiquitin carboxyl-terminal hydrolase 2 [Quercus suber]
MQSQDMVSRRDVNRAYRFLHIPEPTYQQDDNRILDCFQAMLGDVSQQAAEDARQALWRIGISRGSQKLIRASRQSLETYDDALAWLGNGLDKGSPDDAILAVLAVKNDENSANQEIGRQAVTVIANARDSQYLRDYLTGNADANAMSVDEALRHLNITERIETLKPDVLAFVFSNARDDRPGDITERAIKTIEAALHGGMTSNRPPPETWPVGLTSHGNTCYLNSLLQYYFSIKPFRDIVLDFDTHKFSGKELKKTHRVNGVFLKPAEIYGGQQYAEYLKALFQCMICDPGFSVKPENALIKRTFLDLADYHLLDEPVDAIVDSQAPQNNDATQVAGPSPPDNNGDADMTNTEGPLTPPPSPGHEQQKPDPEGVPSLPQRPVTLEADRKKAKLALADERVRNQQDVNDVLDKVMTRLRAGIEPKGFDQVDEEQVDDLRDIFLIGMTETEEGSGLVPSKVKKVSDIHIQLQVPTEDTNLYAALDRYFDLQADVGDRETYKSIHRIPSVFQVAIPRSFRDEQGNNQKAEQIVKLEDELYLDRYVDESHPDVLKRRRDCWSLRRQVQRLKDEKRSLVQTSVGLDGPATLAETAKYLRHNVQEANQALEDIGVEPIEVPPQLPEVLVSDAAHLLERDAAISKEIDGLEEGLQGRFEDLKSLKYRLAAVFMHKGGGGGGHYWIYIHDFANNVWRKYNDETVEAVSELQEIYESKPGKRIPTPTYAVYVRDEAKDQILQPVSRQLASPPRAEAPVPAPAQGPPPQVSDVEMTGTVDPNKLRPDDGANGNWDAPRQDAHVNW